jgi:hypothetical protein
MKALFGVANQTFDKRHIFLAALFRQYALFPANQDEIPYPERQN